jgi:hypothetical protein
MKYFFAFGFLLLSQLVWGQDITNVQLRWQVDEMTDLKTNETFVYQCSFQSNGSQPIQWSQKGGTISSVLAVASSSGSWNNVAAPGDYAFQISKDNLTGTAIFERTASGVFITIDLSSSNPNAMRARFRVATITPVN